MAIKLIGTDVPNTTATPQPDLGVPMMPEDSGKMALQMTSQGLQNTSEVLARSNAQAAETVSQVSTGTQRALGASYEYEQRFMQTDREDKSMGGLVGLADTVARVIDSDQKRRSAEAKQKSEDEFFRVSATVDGFTAQLQTALRTNPGGFPEFERQFKQLVDGSTSLTTEHRAKLYSQFYGAVSPINAEAGRNLVQNQEKYQGEFRNGRIQDATRDTSFLINAIKYADSNETRDENLRKIDEVYAQIMVDPALSPFDRLVILNNVKAQANEALKDSIESQQLVVNQNNNYAAFIQGANRIRALREQGQISQADSEAQIGLLAQRYKIPDNISKVYAPNYSLSTSVENLELLARRDKAVSDAEIRAQDAVPFTDLLIGSLVAQARADKNSSVLANLKPGTRNYQRVVGVIDTLLEYRQLRTEVNQANLILQGDALKNSESFARAVLSRVKGNPGVDREMLVRMGISVQNASIFDAIIKGNANPQQEAKAVEDLRQVYISQNQNIAQLQRANNEKLLGLQSQLRQYGLDQDTDKFPWKRFEAERQTFDRRVDDARKEREQEAIRLNPNARPFGQSNLFFKVPQLAVVQAGRKGQTFAPFKPGTQFSLPSRGEHLNDRGKHKHAGQDYSAAEGTPIIAHIPMKVVSIKNDPEGYGHYVTTQGSDGMYYRYAHLPGRPSLNVGQIVQAGQEFARVGNTGRSTGPHLHLEVRTNTGYGSNGTLDPIEHMKRFKPGASPQMPRGQNYEQFYNGEQDIRRASIPRNAVPLKGGLFIFEGQVYNKDTLLRVVSSRYSPSVPIRQANNPSDKAAYKAKTGEDSNHGYAVLRDDSALRRELNATARRLGIPPVWLADVIADETGGTFSADVGNGMGHYGLIQFDEGAARGVGTSLSALKQMTPAQQMRYVEKYIRQRTNNGKWITSPHDLKAAIWYGNSSPESMRKLWNNADSIDDGQITWRGFANRLGRYAGRKYDSPLTRRQRLQSRLRNDTPSLVASNSTGMYMEVYS